MLGFQSSMTPVRQGSRSRNPPLRGAPGTAASPPEKVVFPPPALSHAQSQTTQRHLPAPPSVDFSPVTLAREFFEAESPNVPIIGVDDEEPATEDLCRLRSLSVDDTEAESHFEDIDSLGMSQSSMVSSNTKRSRGSDFDDETLAKLGRTTPPKAPTPFFTLTPDSSDEANPFFASVTPPTPPRRPLLGSGQPSPESPGGVAARRAAAGKLPNKALVSLQQMRFEAHDAGMGLGVGPGSPGFDGMEGIAPVSPGAGAGMTFRLALGLTDGKDVEPKASPSDESENLHWGTTSSSLDSPSLLRQSSTSSAKGKRRAYNRSPPSPNPASSEAVKIPPTLRGSKILDKLNLSSPPSLTSPLHRDRPAYAASPPSPLIIRTSAFNHSNTGPLTPLTPSHVPGAPILSGGGGFDWFSYSMPDSPNCPSAPIRSVFLESGISPRQPFFLPTPPSDAGRPSPRSFMQLPGSPLGERRANPFFPSSP